MTATDLLKEARLDEALEVLQKMVRDDPAEVKGRVFLFQLLAVLGDWQRAQNQLQVLARLDTDSKMLAQIFEPILLCEIFRADVFAGKRTPLVFGQPFEWIGLLVQSIVHFSRNEFEASKELRDKAFADAPMSSGTLNGESFEWIADADERLGPVLEVILDGRYYWVPFARIRQVFIEPAADLRDLVWVPAQFQWENGGEATGHIPTRYSGTEHSSNAKLKLSHRTEWIDKQGTYLGIGQRVLATDKNEYPLLEVRKIVFDQPALATQQAANL